MTRPFVALPMIPGSLFRMKDSTDSGGFEGFGRSCSDDSLNTMPRSLTGSGCSTACSNEKTLEANHAVEIRQNELIQEKVPADSRSLSTTCTCLLSEDDSDQDEHHAEHSSQPLTAAPPDALFVVQDVDFPCHKEVLSREVPFLLDELTRIGVVERRTKKQRFSNIQGSDKRNPDSWTLQSGMTVAVLSRDIDSKLFGAMIAFLYTGEIQLDIDEECQDEEEKEDREWLMGGNDAPEETDSDKESLSVASACSILELPCPLEDQQSSTETPLSFLKKLYALAERFCCNPLKFAIEETIYNEFLFAFTAEDILIWADENKCAYLKEKAMDKIILVAIKENRRKDEYCRELFCSESASHKRLQDELFIYEAEGCHDIDFTIPPKGFQRSDTENNPKLFMKIEYLRYRLELLGLAIDGSREMLEQRLRPHIKRKGRKFLPSALSKLV